MIVAAFSTKQYDKAFLESETLRLGLNDLEWRWYEEPLRRETANLAKSAEAVCCFVNDELDKPCVDALGMLGVKLICLRCAGFNQVDLEAMEQNDIQVVRVPKYSPHAVAEHTVGLMLVLNRKIHKAYNRVREGNFSLDGLLGFDLHGQTVGVVGAGQIGRCVAEIMLGFGCKVIAHDIQQEPDLCAQGVLYTSLSHLLAESKIVTLHCPLTPETHHLIDAQAINQLNSGAMLINTSRGGLIDTKAAIRGLKQGKIGCLGLDVYEEEGDLFFDDKSGVVIQDDTFMRLLTFPNVVVTGHQAYFTTEAMNAIAAQTVRNLANYMKAKPLEALVTRD